MSGSRFEKKVTVNLRMGLHMRPAGMLSQEAGKYPCEVRLIPGDKTILNAKSYMDLISLGTRGEFGTVLTLETEGDQAEEAMQVLVQLFEDNFGIDEDEEFPEGGN